MILPSAYLGPVSYFKLISENPNHFIESKAHFTKQTYRNRCYIYGANGSLGLTIPLQKWKNHTKIEDVLISYDENWQTIHWKSIESAYRTSPYFEYYEMELRPFYESKAQTSLLEFNTQLQLKIADIIKLQYTFAYTEKYESTNPDWRILMHPRNQAFNATFNFPKYIQVFEDKYGFLSNLSILDALFNLGPKTLDYINSIEINK
ncbi:MAG: hypothetical protein DWP98_02630 [Bacteroidetes bacterium]|nr:MAG: hypothetical protein DWP98_02630 [Bacteroidota bacterium]MBL1144326.1 hypothetical protein [Bacteroidota bacterium]MCB0801604.1 WbqC family protein [Flavobacteriales bacterium]NOG57122.1 hypothetical protein [Bacteroidota bacterium]